MNRRRTLWWVLLAVILMSVVGMMTTSVLGAAAARQSDWKIAVALKDARDLSSIPVPQGAHALAVRFSRNPTQILLSYNGDTWQAFSNRSTHQGEAVFPAPEKGVFIDPHSGAIYDRNGRNIAGPAPRGLDAYPVTIEGDYLVIDLSRPILGR